MVSAVGDVAPQHDADANARPRPSGTLPSLATTSSIPACARRAYGLAAALAIMPVFCLASAAVLMVAVQVYPAEFNAARTLAAMRMASD